MSTRKPLPSWRSLNSNCKSCGVCGDRVEPYEGSEGYCKSDAHPHSCGCSVKPKCCPHTHVCTKCHTCTKCSKCVDVVATKTDRWQFRNVAANNKGDMSDWRSRRRSVDGMDRNSKYIYTSTDPNTRLSDYEEDQSGRHAKYDSAAVKGTRSASSDRSSIETTDSNGNKILKRTGVPAYPPVYRNTDVYDKSNRYDRDWSRTSGYHKGNYSHPGPSESSRYGRNSYHHHHDGTSSRKGNGGWGRSPSSDGGAASRNGRGSYRNSDMYEKNPYEDFIEAGSPYSYGGGGGYARGTSITGQYATETHSKNDRSWRRSYSKEGGYRGSSLGRNSSGRSYGPSLYDKSYAGTSFPGSRSMNDPSFTRSSGYTAYRPRGNRNQKTYGINMNDKSYASNAYHHPHHGYENYTRDDVTLAELDEQRKREDRKKMAELKRSLNRSNGSYSSYSASDADMMRQREDRDRIREMRERNARRM